jgi:hypothetical protein
LKPKAASEISASEFTKDPERQVGVKIKKLVGLESRH